jgi:hypothetical protein
MFEHAVGLRCRQASHDERRTIAHGPVNHCWPTSTCRTGVSNEATRAGLKKLGTVPKDLLRYFAGVGTARGAIPRQLMAADPGVSDGSRTRDILDHNQVLYQLSYTHQGLAWPAPPTMVAGDPAGHCSGIRSRTTAAAAWASSELGPGSGTKMVRR